MLTYEYYKKHIEDFKTFKGKDLVPLNCCHCTQLYYKKQRICRNGIVYEDNKKNYCSKQCQTIDSITSVTGPCKHCGELVTRYLAEYKKSKKHNIFCNHSCAAKYNNKHKTTGTRRSKIECYIDEQLKMLYPQLNIVTNSVSLMNFELDFYFPEVRFAVELNGIVHYEPIYGQDKFDRIQNNDKQKMIRCAELGIELMVINVAGQGKFTIQSSQKYLDIIKEQLDTIMGRKEPTQTL